MKGVSFGVHGCLLLIVAALYMTEATKCLQIKINGFSNVRVANYLMHIYRLALCTKPPAFTSESSFVCFVLYPLCTASFLTPSELRAFAQVC